MERPDPQDDTTAPAAADDGSDRRADSVDHADGPEAPQALPVPTLRRRVEKHPHATALLIIRLVYLVVLATVALLPFVGSVTDQAEITFGDYAGAFVAVFTFGIGVLVVDAVTPNKRLASVFGIYLGVVAGLVGALAIGALIDLVADTWGLRTGPFLAYKLLAKLAVGISLCYLAVSIVLTTKDDFRLVIPYVEFAKQVRGVRPLLLDTSALIDGRIEACAKTRFIDAPLVVPQFVIDELQALGDSSDRLKRGRGRRGLELLARLQASPYADVTLETPAWYGVAAGSVDRQLVRMADEQKYRILTTDASLEKVASIQGVAVLNLNDLAAAVRPPVQTGDALELELVRRGEEADQGVGYLPDGTMVVVERGADAIGHTVHVVVTNVLQTSAGRLVFARPDGAPAAATDATAPSAAASMAQAATQQPRTPPPIGDPRKGSSRRNPRR